MPYFLYDRSFEGLPLRTRWTWRNHVLSGRPSKERAYKKYDIREARLKLITRWVKRCSRHYKRTQPHRQKRLRMVLAYLYETLCRYCTLYMSWKRLQWSQGKHITTRRCHYQQDRERVSFVSGGHISVAGAARQLLAGLFLCVLSLSDHNATCSCITCETSFEYLNFADVILSVKNRRFYMCFDQGILKKTSDMIVLIFWFLSSNSVILA